MGNVADRFWKYVEGEETTWKVVTVNVDLFYEDTAVTAAEW